MEASESATVPVSNAGSVDESSSSSSSVRPGVAALFDAALQSVNVERGSTLLGDGAAFLVVGVVGRLGVGKSTLASELCRSSGSQEASAFGVRGASHVAEARHCTDGVNMFVTADRVIVLDSQPILAASLPNAAGTEQRLLAWLLSVCHVVVVVSGSASCGVRVTAAAPVSPHEQLARASQLFLGNDGLPTPARPVPKQAPASAVVRGAEYVHFGAGHAGSTWRAVRAALLLRRGLPCVSLLDKVAPDDAGKHAAERCATAVFAFAKLPFATIEDWRLARHAHGADAVANAIALTFEHTDLLPGSVPPRDEQRFADAAHEPLPASSGGASDGVLYVMLPREPHDAADPARLAYADAIDVFRATVLSAPRRRFVNAAITEREWLRNAALAWQLLAQSKVVKDFAKANK